MKAQAHVTLQDRTMIHATLNDKLMNFVGANRCIGGWARWESLEFVKKTFPSWQYTGAAPFDEVMQWCEQHLHNDWIWNFETIYFKTEQERTMFMLRWA